MEKLPKDFYTFCPRCGSEEFYHKKGNSFCCQHCSLDWYFNSAAAADIIIENEQGEILVTKRGREPAKGTLDFPGGFVDANESAEEAIRREVLEELGIKIGSDVNIRYLASFPNTYACSGLVYYALDLIFVTQLQNHVLKIGDDVSEAAFRSIKNLCPEDFGLQSTRRAFSFYKQQREQSE